MQQPAQAVESVVRSLAESLQALNTQKPLAPYAATLLQDDIERLEMALDGFKSLHPGWPAYQWIMDDLSARVSGLTWLLRYTAKHLPLQE